MTQLRRLVGCEPRDLVAGDKLCDTSPRRLGGPEADHRPRAAACRDEVDDLFVSSYRTHGPLPRTTATESASRRAWRVTELPTRTRPRGRGACPRIPGSPLGPWAKAPCTAPSRRWPRPHEPRSRRSTSRLGRRGDMVP